MPLFEKKKEAQEVRKLSDIVMDMLASNVPDDQILKTLLQMGVAEAEAASILEGAKKEFRAFAETRLTYAMDNWLDKKKADITGLIDAETAGIKKELTLQTDLKMLEQKNYIDKKADAAVSEVGSVKSDLFSYKVNMDSKMQGLEAELDRMRFRGPAKLLMGVCLVIAGIILSIWFALTLKVQLDLGDIPLSEKMFPLAAAAVPIIAGVVLVKFGLDVLNEKKHKEFKEVGLDKIGK
jgi:hypothetical protein